MNDVGDTIPEALHDAARRFGDLEALVDHDRRLTFRQLEAEVRRAAAAFVRSGIQPGDRVAIWAPNSAAWIIACGGIYSAGAVVVPLNTRYRGDEAGHVLRTSGARLLITVTDFLGTDYLAMLADVPGLDAIEETVIMRGPAPDGTTGWDAFLARSDETDGAGAAEDEVARREAAIGADDICDIIFTSGTTGAPKGAMLTHGASVRTYRQWSEQVGLQQGDRYLVVYPFFHTAGLKSGVLACVLTGATIVPLAVFDVDDVMRRVVEERITVLPGTPTVFQSILNHPDFDTFDLSTLRVSVTGAAVVPVEVIRRMREDLKLKKVVTGYGLTETTGTVSMCRHDDPPEVIALTVGKPLHGVEVRVVDDDGADVPAGEPGEFLVRGFNIMKGYFNNPEATAQTIDAEGWLSTGDIGYVDGDGNLRITDRKKDMFIVGGFNAYPAEIENMMVTHPDIAQVAVVGIPDERMGEVGVAFVVARSGHRADPDEVVEWCRQHMANFKVPRRVEVVAEFPVNPSGKVMKFILRDLAAGRG